MVGADSEFDFQSEGWTADEAAEASSFSSEALRDAIAERLARGTFPVPPLPAALVELNAQTERTDWDIGLACATLERDAALAGRVLAAASSAAYGVSPPANLQQAVMRLGALGLRDLCFALMLGRVFPARGSYRLLIEQEHLGAFPRARASQQVFAVLGLDSSAGFLGGLLADVGRLALLAFLASHPATQRRVDIAPGLMDLLHPEVGEQVIARWELAPVLRQMARWHHEPDGACDEVRPTAGAVWAAVTLLDLIETECPIDEAREILADSPSQLIASLPRDEATELLLGVASVVTEEIEL